jgi:hypothetical protein
MRKIISLVFLTLAAGLFAAPLIADAQNECADLKDATPGLFGLCIAYHNTDDPQARSRIEANYEKIRERSGFTDRPLVEEGCPCFSEEDFDHAIAAHNFKDCGISTSGIGLEFIAFESGSTQEFNALIIGDLDGDGKFDESLCNLYHDATLDGENAVITKFKSPLSTEEVEACFTAISSALITFEDQCFPPQP